MNISLRYLAPAIALATIAAPVGAQQFDAPAGWTQSVAAGDVVFSRNGGDSRFVLKKLTPLDGSLGAWFDNQIARDLSSRGEIVSRGKRSVGRKIATGFVVRSPRGQRVVIYAGYRVGNQGRLQVFSGPTAATSQGFAELNGLRRQIDRFDAANASSTKPRVVSNAGVSTSNSNVKVKNLPAVVARGTLKSSQILGVFLDESYSSGVGGMTIITFDPVLVLRDGSARRDLEIPPLDVNLARDKASHKSDWGRWTRRGDKIVVKWAKGESDEIRASYKTRPARAGERLGTRYTSIGGGGNTALGGSVMTFSSNSYAFGRDGRFTTESSGGGSAPGVVANSNSKNAGRYRLDGHALTLVFNDGRRVRQLFYFYPGKNPTVIGIGDDSFTSRS